MNVGAFVFEDTQEAEASVFHGSIRNSLRIVYFQCQGLEC